MKKDRNKRFGKGIQAAAIVIVTAAVMVGILAVWDAWQEAKTLEAMQQTPQTVFSLGGVITQVTDGALMIEDARIGEVQVLIDEHTQTEGAEELLPGQYAVILYDGVMTRSLPAQITAQRISVYVYEGTVTATEEGQITMNDEKRNEEIVVTLPDGAPVLHVGDRITVYTDGTATMSLPMIVNGQRIIREEE